LWSESAYHALPGGSGELRRRRREVYLSKPTTQLTEVSGFSLQSQLFQYILLYLLVFAYHRISNMSVEVSCGSYFPNKSLRKSPDLQNDLFQME
jgi:hypothetical protein